MDMIPGIKATAASPEPLSPLDLPMDFEVPDIAEIAANISGFFTSFIQRLEAQLSFGSIWLQIAGILGALLLAFLLIRILRAATNDFFSQAAENFRDGRYDKVLRSLAFPVATAFFLWLIIAGFTDRRLPVEYMRLVGALLVAFIVVRGFASPRTDPFWRYVITTLAVLGALFTILRMVAPLIGFIDSLILPFGDNLSMLDILTAFAFAVALIWGAAFFSRMIEARLGKSPRMTPSVRGLFTQLIRILLIGAAIVISLRVIGIDLTAFAVFTGALGVGIGFGLQSIFSNFMAGIIIILEKTLKVGDFVDLESGITGEVQEINVRSTLIRTNDNIDMLIPNSEFINKRVINWTLKEAKRRTRIPVGVAYGSDKELVKKALLEAAEQVDYTLQGFKNRKPDVWLVNFGDSSLDFELVVWLTDEATKKPLAVHAAYCWEIETALTKYGITIPFPQRDLHLIPPSSE